MRGRAVARCRGNLLSPARPQPRADTVFRTCVPTPRDHPERDPQPPLPPGEGGGVDPASPTRKNPIDHGSALPVFVGGPPPDRGPFAPGDRVGKYLILKEISGGGFAVVYHARQTEEISREVAIKAIRRDRAADPEVRARFLQEQQLLASMNHPNIVKVYEVGQTPQGVPYCAMQYIPGPPLTTYCDERQLTIPSRMKIMVEVCEAVYHANQRGIIHRDLSPSNILVMELPGADPARGVGIVPIVIDFNAAKWLAATLGRQYTAIDQVIGKLPYMSPEQMTPSLAAVDHRTDVYSLGVVLYELLVGRLPIPADELESAAIDKAREIVKRKVPEKPSTALSSMGGDRATTVAARRGSRVEAIARELRGGAGAVPLMALEKNREHRYRDARDMADDLRRVLAGERPRAERFSFGIYAEKLVSRYRPYAWAAALVVLALGVGVVALGIAAQIATLERNRAAKAAAAEATANQIAQRERAEAESARDLAEAESYAAQIAAADIALRHGQSTEARQRLDAAPEGRRGWEWRHLSAIADGSAAASPLPEFRAGIVGFAAGPDGQPIVASVLGLLSWQHQIGAWRPLYHAGVASLPGEKHEQGSSLNIAAIAPDASAAVVMVQPPPNRFDIPWKTLLARLEPDENGRLRIVSAAVLGTPAPDSTGAWRRLAAFSSSGKFAAVRLDGDKVCIVSTRDPAAMPRPIGEAPCFAFADGEETLVLGDAVLTRHDCELGKPIAPLAPSCWPITPDEITVRGARVFAVREGAGYLWDAGSARLIGTVHSATGAAAWLDDHRLAVAADTSIRIVDALTCGVERTLLGHDRRISALARAPGGSTDLLSGDSLPGVARRWKTQRPDAFVAETLINAAKPSPRGVLLVIDDERTRRFEVRNPETGRILLTIDGDDKGEDGGPYDGALWNHDASEIIISGERGLRIHDAATGARLRRFGLPEVDRGHAGRATVDDLLPVGLVDSERAAVLRPLMGALALYLMNLNDGTIEATREWDYAGFGAAPPTVVRSATGPQVAIALGRKLELWDNSLVSCNVETVMSGPISSLAWSPDGSNLAVGLFNGAVVVLNRGLSTVVTWPEAHESTLAAAWSDERPPRLFTSGREGLIRVWDVSAQRLMLTVQPRNPAQHLALDRMGSLYTAEQNIRATNTENRAAVWRVGR